MESLINSSIFYGLIAMSGWGLGNLLLASASRKTGPFRVAFLMQTLAFFPVLMLWPITKKSFPSVESFLLLSLLGISGGGGFLLFLKALTIGSVSVVAPIYNSGVIITAALSFIFLKEPASWLKISAIVLVVAGSCLLSADLRKIAKEKKFKLLAGAKLATLAAVIIGINCFLLALFSRKIGWYPVNLGARFWTAAFFLLTAILTRRNINQFFKAIPKVVLLIACLDVFTFMLFNIGLAGNEPAVVSAVGGSSPLVSVTLAAIFLKEKTTSWQKLGVFLCLMGIVGLSLA